MLAGLKFHLAIYTALIGLLTVSGYATKRYYTQTVNLQRSLELANAEIELHKKDAQVLRDLIELDRQKSEELKRETEKALVELEKVKRNANVKVFLNTVIPPELNDWLRKRHPDQN